MNRIAQETSWDNPVVQAELAAPQKGFIAWFKRKVLSRDDTQNGTKQVASTAYTRCYLQKNSDMFYQLVRKRDDLQNKSITQMNIWQTLGQVRSKFNDLT